MFDSFNKPDFEVCLGIFLGLLPGVGVDEPDSPPLDIGELIRCIFDNRGCAALSLMRARFDDLGLFLPQRFLTTKRSFSPGEVSSLDLVKMRDQNNQMNQWMNVLTDSYIDRYIDNMMDGYRDI